MQVQKFYLLIDKMKDVDDDIHDYLATKLVDSETREMKIDDLKTLLIDMELVGSKDENWDYFKEDFDPED